MHKLITQHESQANSLHQTFGYELFHDDAEDFYTARFHIRTYDGIRVGSAWASGEVRLDADSRGGASMETQRQFETWLKSIGAQK